MGKRIFDVVASFCGLLVFSPVLLVFMVLVWRQDRHSPFYYGERTGRDGRLFKMVKLRSMVMNADKSGVDSTSADDRRITRVGHMIRKYKLDEITQLWNVLKGEMSLVGPRPNVKRETDLYTAEEKRLLTLRPGITDMASVVFADEGKILSGKKDPDLAYNQLIRPWKSRLGLVYVDNNDLWLDIKLIWITAMAVFIRYEALDEIGDILEDMRDEGARGIDGELIAVARREKEPYAAPPPGAAEIVQSRDVRAA